MLAADTVVSAGRRILPKAENPPTDRRLPDTAVRPAPPGVDGDRADRAGRDARRAAGREHRHLQSADRRPDRPLRRDRAKATARPAAMRSTAMPPASSVFCPAVTPAWSVCRCSRPRRCCAATAGRCRERHDPCRHRAPARYSVAVVATEALLDYALWRPGAPDGVGDLHRGPGRSPSVPAMAGAIRRAAGRRGLSARQRGRQGPDRRAPMLRVRVTRAAQGSKGPRLTARPSRRSATGRRWSATRSIRTGSGGWPRDPDARRGRGRSAWRHGGRAAARVELVAPAVLRRGRGGGDRGPVAAGRRRAGGATAVDLADAGAGGDRRRCRRRARRRTARRGTRR